MHLRHESNLGAKPLDVEILDLVAVNLDTSTDGIVESFNQTNNGRLSTSTTSNESGHLAVREVGGELVKDLDGRTTGVDEVDVLESDVADDALGLESVGRGRVDDGITVDRSEDGGGSCDGERKGLHVGSDLRKREGTDEDGEEHVDNLSTVGVSREDQGSSKVEGETVGAVCSVNSQNDADNEACGRPEAHR